MFFSKTGILKSVFTLRDKMQAGIQHLPEWEYYENRASKISAPKIQGVGEYLSASLKIIPDTGHRTPP